MVFWCQGLKVTLFFLSLPVNANRIVTVLPFLSQGYTLTSLYWNRSSLSAEGKINVIQSKWMSQSYSETNGVGSKVHTKAQRTDLPFSFQFKCHDKKPVTNPQIWNQIYMSPDNSFNDVSESWGCYLRLMTFSTTMSLFKCQSIILKINYMIVPFNCMLNSFSLSRTGAGLLFFAGA